MFGFGTGERTVELRKRIRELENVRDKLTDRNSLLKVELDEKEHKRKLADEDLKHMVKMREEALELKFEKKALELQRKRDAEVASIKDEYRDKMEAQLGSERDNIKSMYEDILQRPPKVSVRQVDGNTHHTERTLEG